MINIKDLQQLSSPLTVLYVEDELGLQKSITLYLSKFFIDIKVASDGMEGLELYKQHKFDIVITDINMPRMDGLEMLDHIKEINSNQNTVIISAYSNTDHFMRSIQLGVDGYILKPIDFKQMNDTLYKIVTKIHKFKENEYYSAHLKELVEIKTKENLDAHKQTLYSLVTLIEQRDTYTGGHSQRVAQYSKLLASAMGFSKKECEDIYEAGILHDIGKIAIPDTILLKPDSLNDNEYSLIQSHTKNGFDMLMQIEMFKGIADVIISHHERYDGSGYPYGLKGKEIPVYSRVMAVADTFDAMTTNRIYKAKKNVTDAITEIKSLGGTLFCPEVIKYVDILGDIEIDKNISQLPSTQLEKERFSYFYKDQLTGLYNENYLKLIISQNLYANNYKYYNIISVKELYYYNENNGWEKGDMFLNEFSKFLTKLYSIEDIFRVHGYDFIILSVEQFDYKNNDLVSFLNQYNIKVDVKTIKIEELEKIIQ